MESNNYTEEIEHLERKIIDLIKNEITDDSDQIDFDQTTSEQMSIVQTSQNETLSDEDITVDPNYNQSYVIDEKPKIEFKKQLWKKKENIYCNNCGKYGHIYKKCFEPITSYGIICLNLNNNKTHDFFVSKYKFPNNSQQLKNICINKYIQKNISCNNRKDLDFYENKILKSVESVIVRRKYTYNFIHLIRGTYELELESIIRSINLLTKSEYIDLITKSYDKLWQNIWGKTGTNFETNTDYIKGFEQFRLLRENIIPQISHKINIKYTEPEWGFAKGKRISLETNIECAKREFFEETGLSESDYDLLDRLYPMIETVVGSNGITYRHIYYIALLKSDIDTNSLKNNINSNFEIGDIKSISIENSINILRDYNTERKDIIDNIVLFFMYNMRYFEKFYRERDRILNA